MNSCNDLELEGTAEKVHSRERKGRFQAVTVASTAHSVIYSNFPRAVYGLRNRILHSTECYTTPPFSEGCEWGI